MSLIVENLSNNVTLNDLRKLFGKAGSCSIDLVIEKHQAIINYSWPKDARKAYESYQGHPLHGSKIKIFALDLPNRSNKATKVQKSSAITPETIINSKCEDKAQEKKLPNFLQKKRPFSHVAARKTAGFSIRPIQSDDEDSQEDEVEESNESDHQIDPEKASEEQDGDEGNHIFGNSDGIERDRDNDDFFG
jgi:RNA recognition motif-containing protein